MPSAVYPLDTFASVALDAFGNGIVSLGPAIVREHWQPGSVYVSVSTNTNEAACTVAVGTTPQAVTGIGQTPKGSSGDTCSLGGDMPSGYKIWVTWSGGDAGATATAHVTGARSIGVPAS